MYVLHFTVVFSDNQTPTQENDTNNKSQGGRRSTRLSGLFDRNTVSGVTGEGGSSQCSTQTSTCSQSKTSTKLSTISKPAGHTKPSNSSSSESAGTDSSSKRRLRTRSNPESETCVSLNKSLTKTPVVLKKRINTRQSVGSSLLRTISEKPSQVNDQCSQNDEAHKKSRVHTRRSLGTCLPEAAKRTPSQAVLNMHVELGRAARNDLGGERSSSGDDGTNSSLRKQKRGASSMKQNCRKGGASRKTKSGTANSASLELLHQTRHVGTGTSKTASVKTTSKKRKLLNPSQELHILSPSPTDNQNSPTSASGSAEPQMRGKKRKSCDVDAIFPSMLPAPKRGCRSLQSKENQGMRRRSSQVDPTTTSTSEESLSEPCSNRKKKRPTKSRKASRVTKERQAASVSSLFSTSQASSILGSSMSMMFSESSSTAPSGRRLAPPRDSMWEFQPPRHRKHAASKVGSSMRSEQSSLMSLQKFRLSCLPSLVMTSLHRP